MNSMFCGILKENLESKGITQRELAEAIGVTDTTISRYVCGDRIPKATEIVKIADYLNISADYLLGQSPKEYSIPDLIRILSIKSNDMTKPVSDCMEYHKAKLLVEKTYQEMMKNG